MNNLKRLICRLIGHKDYATVYPTTCGIRCARCGRGKVRHYFINRDALAALDEQMARIGTHVR